MSSQGHSTPKKHLNLSHESGGSAQPILTFHTGGYIKDGCRYWSWAAVDGENQTIIKDSGRCAFGVTVNDAKSYAVIEALRWVAATMPDKPVRVLCGLTYVVNTVSGTWKAHTPETKLLCQSIRKLLRRTYATLEWVTHERQRAACG